MNGFKNIRWFVFGLGLGLVILMGDGSYGNIEGDDGFKTVDAVYYKEKNCDLYKKDCGIENLDPNFCYEIDSMCDGTKVMGRQYIHTRHIGKCVYPREGFQPEGTSCQNEYICSQSNVFKSRTFQNKDGVIIPVCSDPITSCGPLITMIYDGDGLNVYCHP